jgi:hypothetical protein
MLRAPLVVSFAIRERTLQLADVLEALRFILVLVVGAGAALGICRLLPVEPVVTEVAGLVIVAAISGTVLFFTFRPPNRAAAS